MITFIVKKRISFFKKEFHDLRVSSEMPEQDGFISFLHVVIVSSKWKFFRGIVITFPAVFYIFLGIFSARMHKISHEAKPSEKFYAWRLRKCQEKCRKQLEKCWQFQGKIGTCETALPHVRILFSVIHASIPKKKFWIFKRIS